MRIGYSGLAIALPDSGMIKNKLNSVNTEQFLSLMEHNLSALERHITYNAKNNIPLFMISSELIPFTPDINLDLCWQKIFSEKLYQLGQKIFRSDMRLFLQASPYAALNSKDSDVHFNNVKQLNNLTQLFDKLGLRPENKIFLYPGGSHDDKSLSIKRFAKRCRDLEPTIKKHLIIKNDTQFFNIEDALSFSSIVGIPVVYDNLHNLLNTADKKKDDADWIKLCADSWGENDGPQTIYYGQPLSDKPPGTLSGVLQIAPFLKFYQTLPDQQIDIILEASDRNLSVLKCLHCTKEMGISSLETEWARYKYLILEHSPDAYQQIRQLLKNKHSYPALKMYQIIEDALDLPVSSGNAINAAQHIWGYFKNRASSSEGKHIQTILEQFSAGKLGLDEIKKELLKLAEKYQVNYLLNGYYFYL
ncbi:DUF1722 domain-containing protein [Eubacteriaceae bacterium ES3]|nr:DUF1722 domain-containing protein [Eubacteriaceae bacterium ES3]